MTLNARGDLYRIAWNDPHAASARCDTCHETEFLVEGLTPAATGAKARDHTRTTGHVTRVTNECVTVYRSGPEASDGGS